MIISSMVSPFVLITVPRISNGDRTRSLLVESQVICQLIYTDVVPRGIEPLRSGLQPGALPTELENHKNGLLTSSPEDELSPTRGSNPR